jgi:DNA topoisomerase VI subunit A
LIGPFPPIKMSLFKLDKECSIAQFISKEEVIARIEMHSVDYLLQSEAQTHEFHLISRCRENQVKTDNIIHLGDKVKKRKLGSKVSKKTYEQTWACLAHIHKNLLSNKLTTQRDMYYCLINYFDSQTDVNERIQDIVGLLEVPRSCLGLFATSKGFIAGNLLWNEGNGWIDGSKIGSPGIPIPGMIPEKLKIQSDARYILVIEKDGLQKNS